MLAYKTPEQRKKEYLDDAVSLIIVHTNLRHDPDKVSKKPIQQLIDSNIADYIYEFMAFHESFAKHDGIIIDNNRAHGNYYIENLAGSDYIIVGGSLGNCHFGVYAALLASRFTRETKVHLPADAIYKTFEEYEGGNTFLSSKLSDLTLKEFRKYEALAKTISEGYEIRQDNNLMGSAGDKKLQLMMWSSQDLMVHYLNQQKVKA